MSEYPRLEFRCPHEMDDLVYQLLARKDFVDLEVSKSELLRKSCLLGLQIVKDNPALLKDIAEQDFLKGDK